MFVRFSLPTIDISAAPVDVSTEKVVTKNIVPITSIEAVLCNQLLIYLPPIYLFVCMYTYR
jgi:hypothetical protein